MANIGIDTDKIKISGENIKKYASQYNKVVENMFSTIKKLEENEVWIGENNNSSVKKYIETVLKEKANYSDLALAINNLGDALINYAEDINLISNETV